MHLRSFLLQSLPLFILVLLSPLLHSFFDLLFPLKQSNGKIARMQIFPLFFLSADLSWRSSRVDTTLSDTDAPWVTISRPAFLILHFGVCVCLCVAYVNATIRTGLLIALQWKAAVKSLFLWLRCPAGAAVDGGAPPGWLLGCYPAASHIPVCHFQSCDRGPHTHTHT